MRPAGKARGPRIPGGFEGGATQPGGMQRRSNADGVAPRAVNGNVQYRTMSVKVPLLDLQAQYRPLRDEILAAITRVSDSQRFVMGPETAALEGELERMLGVGHAVAVSSGTDALLLALMTLGVGAGDEVVAPAYSFFASAGVFVRLGARPV